MSPRTLWGLIAAGEIASLNVGRLVRYSPTELQRWIDENTRGGAR